MNTDSSLRSPRLPNGNRLLIMSVLILAAILPTPVMGQRSKSQLPKPEHEFLPPKTVSVFPVFFVASDQKDPSLQQADLLIRHLKWAQKWFRDQLKGGGTFQLFSDQPYLFRGRYPLAHYVGLPAGQRAPAHVQELLEHFQLSRFNCPFVFVVIVDEMKERPAGGRPFNSGFNGGGGIVQMSRSGLTPQGSFQGILRHELGHAFGLQHVSFYQYDMASNFSVMSYNKRTQTKGFIESSTPDILIPEDIRALALNDRVFPDLEFDDKKYVPPGYRISPRLGALPPMKLPDGPQDQIIVLSKAGEEPSSRAQNLVRRQIVPNVRSETNKQGINYDPKSMWHSDEKKTPWKTLELTFPIPAGLTAVRIHSQHSGRIHPVQRFRLFSLADDGSVQAVTDQPITSDDQTVRFAEHHSMNWRLDFQPGKSGKVALRGLQFYFKETELFAAVTSENDVEPSEEQHEE